MSPAALGNGTLPPGPLHIPEGDDFCDPCLPPNCTFRCPRLPVSPPSLITHAAQVLSEELIFHRSKLRLSVNPSREKPKWRSADELLYPSGHRGPYFSLGALHRITKFVLLFVGHLRSDGFAMLRSDAPAWHCRFRSKFDNTISFSSAGCAQSAVAPAAISSSYDP